MQEKKRKKQTNKQQQEKKKAVIGLKSGSVGLKSAVSSEMYDIVVNVVEMVPITMSTRGTVITASA